MIPFHPVTLEDRAWIQPLLEQENSRSADHSFGNIYLWDDTYAQQVAQVAGMLVIRLDYEAEPFYACPVGGGDMAQAVAALAEDAARHGVPLRLRGVCGHHLEELERLYPGQYQLTSDRYVYDYVYLAEKLDTLSGKKLHGKRNHINRFLEEHPDWRFVPMTQEDVPACRAFTQEWLELNADGHPEQFDREKLALERAFRNFRALELEGGLLYVGERLIGYTIGERLCQDTYVVHFEKAHYDIQGSYAILNREFVRYVRQLHPEMIYINREDDMGQDNLRQAKQSYYPALMVDKHTALWQ